MRKYTITFGGWYQRTTLHLTEIYDFLAQGISRLDLSKDKLQEYHRQLRLKNVIREVGTFEFIKGTTEDGIEIRYYEDGLYILQYISGNVKEGQRLLANYFKEVFEPAIAYIFSLGAPTPKVLANIKSLHPTVVGVVLNNPQELEIDTKKFGGVYSTITSGKITVHKTPRYIFVASSSAKFLNDLIEMQIFFREFKDQLRKYLNIHRKIWEEIADVKEEGEIRGNDVEKIRGKLESYQETISLISNRINQMGTYIHTRRSIAKNVKVDEELVNLFQYKFETLSDTHSYIKELWEMTTDYLKSAIQIIVEIENQTTNVSIQSLRTITTVGVISGILGYLTRDIIPQITFAGVIYFFILVISTWVVNRLINKLYKNKKYKLKFTEHKKGI